MGIVNRRRVIYSERKDLTPDEFNRLNVEYHFGNWFEWQARARGWDRVKQYWYLYDWGYNIKRYNRFMFNLDKSLRPDGLSYFGNQFAPKTTFSGVPLYRFDDYFKKRDVRAVADIDTEEKARESRIKLKEVSVGQKSWRIAVLSYSIFTVGFAFRRGDCTRVVYSFERNTRKDVFDAVRASIDLIYTEE